jgi:hypothetical protein
MGVRAHRSLLTQLAFKKWVATTSDAGVEQKFKPIADHLALQTLLSVARNSSASTRWKEAWYE